MRKMRAHSQYEVSKCFFCTLLPILLLLNSWASAGFISPGNSVSIGRSPTLHYLLACAHLAAKPPFFSTHDVYTNDQVAKGLRHLQAALGLPETGLEGEQERQVVKRGKCVNDNSPKKEHVVSSQSGVTFPKASSVEIFETDKANSVNFEEAPARKLGVILPSRNDRFCHQGVRVKRCRQKTNQPCRWFCKKKKKTVQWSSLITEQPQKLLKLASMQK